MRALGFEPKKEEIKKMIADIDKVQNLVWVPVHTKPVHTKVFIGATVWPFAVCLPLISCKACMARY